MPRLYKYLFFTFVVLFLCLSSSYAEDEIRLLNGKTINGHIIENQDDYIKVDSDVGIPITYYKDEIKFINGAAVSSSSSQGMSRALSILSDKKEPVTMDDVAEGLKEGVDVSASIIESQVKDEVQRVQQKFEQFQEEHPEINQKLAKTKTQVQEFTEKSVDVIAQNVPPLTSLAFFFFYFIVTFPMMRIAQKLHVKWAWLAWIPIANLYVIVKMAGGKWWWMIFFFIPVVNFIFCLVLWYKILFQLQKPVWLFIFIMVPGINILLLWYLALVKTR